jgi:hypothetical protein
MENPLSRLALPPVVYCSSVMVLHDTITHKRQLEPGAELLILILLMFDCVLACLLPVVLV